MSIQRMRLKRASMILGLGLSIVAAIAYFALQHDPCIGRPLDSFRGVVVYDNGPLFWKAYGKNYSKEGYYYGQKWQCVEFVKRFYFDAMHHRMPDVMGHAKSFFDENVPQGGTNARRGLIQFRNGGNEPPHVDDLIVFNQSTYGHVAIVASVDTNSVEVIQQNIFGKPREKFSLAVKNGQYHLTGRRTAAGWLRSRK
jgi:hypothetical protein